MKSKLLQEIIKDPTERDIAIDTGCYNSYIKGYLIYTLESMNSMKVSLSVRQKEEAEKHILTAWKGGEE